MVDVRVVLHPKAILDVAKNRETQQRLQRDAEELAQFAAQLAPRDTGALAASIHAEQQDDGTWRVSWDQQHSYGVYQELGTEHHPPHPFLRPAAKRLET